MPWQAKGGKEDPARSRVAMHGVACFSARSAEASACELAYSRTCMLRGGEACSPTARTSGARAWLTLLTNKSYAVGVRALYNSIVETESDYALVVMVTDAVPESVCADLAALGCTMHHVDVQPPPPGASQYASPQFMECWTKLRCVHRLGLSSPASSRLSTRTSTGDKSSGHQRVLTYSGCNLS